MSTHRSVTHSLVRRLGAVPIFSPLGDRALLRVMGASANLHWSDGTTVFSPGDSAEAMYIVISGSVEILDEGRPIARIDEYGWFGELALLHTEASYTRTARAHGDTELLVISREWFDALLKSDPDLAASFRSALQQGT